MNLENFSSENKARCQSTEGFNHLLSDWSFSDWVTALIGELGEAANIVKKLNRIRDGIPGNAAIETPEKLLDMLGDELADTFIYLNLFMQAAGFDPTTIVENKYQRTSRKIGYKQ